MNRAERFRLRSQMWLLATLGLLATCSICLVTSIVAMLNQMGPLAIGSMAAIPLLVAAAINTSDQSRRWAFLSRQELQFSTIEKIQSKRP